MTFSHGHLPQNGESLAEYLRRVRTSLKLSQGEMAQKAGLHIQRAFNGLAKWVGFGHSGVIATNSRDEQCKIIKYNHLVSNCLIFYNVFEMSRILQELMGEGYEIDQEVIGALSPYLTGYINRFGRYSLDLNRQPPVLDYELLSESIPFAVSASEKTDR